MSTKIGCVIRPRANARRVSPAARRRLKLSSAMIPTLLYIVLPQLDVFCAHFSTAINDEKDLEDKKDKDLVIDWLRLCRATKCQRDRRPFSCRLCRLASRRAPSFPARYWC